MVGDYCDSKGTAIDHASFDRDARHPPKVINYMPSLDPQRLVVSILYTNFPG